MQSLLFHSMLRTTLYFLQLNIKYLYFIWKFFPNLNYIFYKLILKENGVENLIKDDLLIFRNF